MPRPEVGGASRLRWKLRANLAKKRGTTDMIDDNVAAVWGRSLLPCVKFCSLIVLPTRNYHNLFVQHIYGYTHTYIYIYTYINKNTTYI